MKENSNKEKEVAEVLKEYEQTISEKKFELNKNFAVKVTEAVENQQSRSIRRLFMNIIQNKKLVAGLSVVCLALIVVAKSDLGKLKIKRGIGLQETPVLSVENEISSNQSSSVIYNDRRENVILNKEKNVILPKRIYLPMTQARKAQDQGKIIAGGVLNDSVSGFSGRGVVADYAALPQNRDQFIEYKEQKRERVSKEGKSTFSIDVDTGSYTFARNYLKLGKKPDKSAVRIEEFLNYFDYNYPRQSKEPFSLHYKIAPAAFDKGRYLLLLGVNARSAVGERKPWNLTFLVDVSGSMQGEDRLGLVKRSLKYLVEQMGKEDKVSIVTYAGAAKLVLDGSSMEQKNKIFQAIENLQSGGSTHGSAGIALAYNVSSKHSIANGVNRVVLATDGDFNVGVQSHKELVSIIEKQRKTGISLSTIGVGQGNFHDGTMEQLANKGNGNYFYLDSFQEARKVFGTKLAGTIETVAKDVKLQVEFNPEHVAEYRLIGYENRTLENQDFSNDKVDAGEIGVGHTVTALYEITFNDSILEKNSESRYKKEVESEVKLNKDFKEELAFLKVRYKEPKGSVSKLLTFPILKSKINLSTDSMTDFNFATAVYYFASLLKESKYANGYNFTDVAKLAEKSLGEDSNGERREFLNLVNNLAIPDSEVR